MFEDSSIAIPCPKCGYKTAKTIRWIKANNKFTCGGCRQVISLDRENLLAGLNKVDKSVADLKRSLGKLGKKR